MAIASQIDDYFIDDLILVHGIWRLYRDEFLFFSMSLATDARSKRETQRERGKVTKKTFILILDGDSSRIIKRQIDSYISVG